MKQARRLRLQRLYNARDLGGFAARDGGVTRFGVFLRSEAPCELPEADYESLLEYGVRATLDLRGRGEVQVRPSGMASRVPYTHCPIFTESVIGSTGEEFSWGEQYIHMSEGSRAWVRQILTVAAEAPEALLFHCTTGKDRTGLLSCYLLSVAGVDPLEIVTDYCISQYYLEPIYDRLRGGLVKIGPNGEEKMLRMDDAFFETPATAMAVLIGHMEANYGGVVPFLQEAGVSRDVMDAIRKKWVAR